MYRCLKGEMVKSGLSIAVLAEKVGVSEKTMRNKLHGRTEFTWSEINKIKGFVAPNMLLEELFKSDDNPKYKN